MGTVFISYRRGDTAGEARALYNELASRFGEESVFMDVDNIALGRDFRQALHERLESCDLMLVLVGRDWVDARNSSGARRLEDPADFVSLEIEAALKRNIAVTPVLVQGAQMPTLEQLPANVKDFAYRNGFELSHSRWESDVQEMFKRLHLAKPAEPRVESPAVPAGISAAAPAVAQRAARKPWAAIAAAALALAAITGGGTLYFQRAAEENARIEQQRLASEKANADTEAKLAASKAEAQRAQADAQAANARAEAARAEQQRLASEKAKADAEAKLAARKAEADRAQADARAANVKAAALAEREKAAAQAERERVATAAEAERERAVAAARAENDRVAAAARAERDGVAAEQDKRKQRIAATLEADRDRMSSSRAQRDRVAAEAQDTCKPGYVWRDAYSGDHVCVTPSTRAQAAEDNRQAPARREAGGGAYGSNTCRQGFVWREARVGDLVCVTPPTRTETASDNRQAAARRVSQ